MRAKGPTKQLLSIVYRCGVVSGAIWVNIDHWAMGGPVTFPQ